MKKTEVFIKNIIFNDGSSYSFQHSDIVVFTGANNSGKSQVLRDIKSNFENKNAEKVIVSNIDADYIGDLQYLKDICINKNGRYYLENINIYQLNNLDNYWNNKDLSSIHRYFINHLSTENRLQASNPASSFDAVNDSPSHPIQKIYIDDKKEMELSFLFHKAFNANIIVNRGAGNNIPIHVGISPQKENGEDRVSVSYLQKLKALPQIQNQGDGMRSFAGILLDTFTSQHTITLIDEPEAFLHPPQARLLGKMLAKNITNGRQIFISTHSEDFLKGLLDANNENIKVIRINREEDINHMNILNNEEIKTFWKDPILRYSNILSGLFHSKVIICESDTDCRFYQAVLNAIHDGENDISPDVLFTHCGGKQRLKTVITALKSLNVKTVTVADIDILNDKVTFKDITEQIGVEWKDIESKWNVIDNYVKNQRAQLDTDEVKKEIANIFDKVTESQLPTVIADKIKKVIKMSSAWSKVKETGKSFLVGEAYTAFLELCEICKNKGLLIVPVGELECFYKPNSNHGTKWVNNVLETIDLKNDPELDNAREFTKKMLEI